jgi:hypothetical protein
MCTYSVHIGPHTVHIGAEHCAACIAVDLLKGDTGGRLFSYDGGRLDRAASKPPSVQLTTTLAMLDRAASKRGTMRSNDNANPNDDPPSSWFRIQGLGSACQNKYLGLKLV